ncbi:MAG: hypothetical protein C0602_04945 [Denitrovibrio sp.]|nr:MAG: hypothetical protein C0602_04945 [Denitrovibrio sp.]
MLLLLLLLFNVEREKCVKLSYKELSRENASFEGTHSFTEGDFSVEVKNYQADFVPTDAGVYLDLRFDYEFKAPCDKCIAETTGFGSERSGVQFLEQLKDVSSEAELKDDDMGTVYVEDDVIELDDIIRQEVIFYLPLKMTCGDDCRGLCPKCGENLNIGSCKCEQDADPRWTALKDIKKN